MEKFDFVMAVLMLRLVECKTLTEADTSSVTT